MVARTYSADFIQTNLLLRLRYACTVVSILLGQVQEVIAKQKGFRVQKVRRISDTLYLSFVSSELQR